MQDREFTFYSILGVWVVWKVIAWAPINHQMKPTLCANHLLEEITIWFLHISQSISWAGFSASTSSSIVVFDYWCLDSIPNPRDYPLRWAKLAPLIRKNSEKTWFCSTWEHIFKSGRWKTTELHHLYHGYSMEPLKHSNLRFSQCHVVWPTHTELHLYSSYIYC